MRVKFKNEKGTAIDILLYWLAWPVSIWHHTDDKDNLIGYALGHSEGQPSYPTIVKTKRENINDSWKLTEEVYPIDRIEYDDGLVVTFERKKV